MKKLILVFVMWPMMVSVFGQNQPFESGCSFKNITDDGDYFVVGCFGTEEYSES